LRHQVHELLPERGERLAHLDVLLLSRQGLVACVHRILGGHLGLLLGHLSLLLRRLGLHVRLLGLHVRLLLRLISLRRGHLSLLLGLGSTGIGLFRLLAEELGLVGLLLHLEELLELRRQHLLLFGGLRGFEVLDRDGLFLLRPLLQRRLLGHQERAHFGLPSLRELGTQRRLLRLRDLLQGTLAHQIAERLGLLLFTALDHMWGLKFVSVLGVALQHLFL